MLAVLLVAVSLGLSDFAASVGIGVSGIDARTRLRTGLIFGVFETGMPIAGLLLGHSLAATLGRAAHWIGAGAVGAVDSVRESTDGLGITPCCWGGISGVPLPCRSGRSARS